MGLSSPARQARSQFHGPALGHRLIALITIISDDSARGHVWISLLKSEMGDYDPFLFEVWKKEISVVVFSTSLKLPCFLNLILTHILHRKKRGAA